MSESLAGKHALITGGGGGIGSAIAAALHDLGARVTLAGRTQATLDASAQRLGDAGRVCTVLADVTDEAAVTTMFAQARAALGRIDILVNNAGAAFSMPFAKTSLSEWERMLAVNLTSAFLCSREGLPPMVDARDGRVVNVASVAGLAGAPYISAYCAAKHGLVGLTRALAMEVAASGVTVNAVCPGYTDTDMVRAATSNIVAKTGRTPDAARKLLVERNPQGRLVRPEEVADAVVWLCQPGASAITAQAMAVAGGEQQ
ncbi:MAG TPA: SDR family NAD(P)-dependent oxidoreductase [Candidatus Eremiobacteraceae bacterium]|nr:SDR family NAD(P)-dependent oxidoreductase [Candidatus Eremiobacteraceae bacterium]